ncbi:MAG: SAM-dependent DNA methyltransferase, partial [Thermogutta sp.]|nr:SAM-dependent DNA methyltransferase [Thermogutta sp.]
MSGEGRAADAKQPPQKELERLWRETPFAVRHSLFAEQALLGLRVCDPACGSGHFLLAAARRLGKELARVRTGEDEPAPERVREAVRDVISHCIYGVDKNPLAVDLCKVALWIEGHTRGKPLTFLDHRIRCGDSLVGVFDLEVLEKGIPDEAFQPVTGDDKSLARRLKRENRDQRRGQAFLPFDSHEEIDLFAGRYSQFASLRDDTPGQVREKAAAYKRIRAEGSKYWQDNTACHLWTAAFFQTMASRESRMETEAATSGHSPFAIRYSPPITTESLRRYLQTQAPDGRLVGQAWDLASRLRFFHWPLEFPDVFASGGFDVVLANPPWELLQPEETEFFATADPEIGALPGARRKAAIERLTQTNPPLAQRWNAYKREIECTCKFLRESHRFPLTAVGKLNTYALFAELARELLNARGRAGVLVPTGIATDDSNKQFFTDLVEAGGLASLFDFENREAIFPAVHRSYKFSLLTMSETPVPRSEFAFFCTRAEQLKDAERRFALTAEDLALLNPNTRTCPVFRTRADAELTKAIYRRVPVLVNERTGQNPWGVNFRQGLFNMSSDSGLFQTAPAAGLVPLYEAKMLWQFDHRFGSYEGVHDRNSTHLPTPTPDQYADPNFVVRPWYWVPA